MKKNYYLALAAVVALASCEKEASVSEGPVAGTPVTVTASIPADGLTRVALSQDESNKKLVKLSWEETDQITINGNAFTIKPETISEDGHSAQFTGTAPDAVGGKYTIAYADLPGTFAAQTQSADGNTDHLGYSVALTDADSFEEVAFSADWASAHGATLAQSSVLRLRAQLPAAVAGAVNTVIFTSSADVFDGGNTLAVTLSTAGTDGEDNVLDVYATLPAGDVTLTEDMDLLVRFQVSDDAQDVYTAYRQFASGTTFVQSGATQYLGLNCSNIESFAGAEDAGTAENPYLIGDRHQMQAMKSLMAADAITSFRLLDDVDLEGIAWDPLNNADPFDKGIDFDGGNHTIFHLTSNANTYDYPSFAGILRGSISDVTFDGASLECAAKKGGVVCGYFGHKKKAYKGNCTNVIVQNSTLNAAAMAGAFAGQGDNIGVLTRCKVINTTVTSTAARIGGMIGSLVSADEFSDCRVEDVTVTGSSYYNGGLVGQMDGNVTISGCYSSGTVSSTFKYSRTGGLVGYMISGTVDNCTSESTVNVSGQFGGDLIGEIQSGTVTNSHASGAVVSSNHFSGGLIGLIDKGSATIRKCYFDGSVTLPDNMAQAGGIVAKVGDTGSTSVSISDCYTTGTITARRWCGGIIGGATANASSVSITNCYTTMSIPNGNNGALIGACDAEVNHVSVTGFIAGWESGNLVATGNTPESESYYIGTEATILEKATEFGWDFTSTWNGVNPPTLK